MRRRRTRAGVQRSWISLFRRRTTHGVPMERTAESRNAEEPTEAATSLTHDQSAASRIFMEQLNEDYRRMQADPELWAEFVRERDEWLFGIPVQPSAHNA